MKKFLKDTRGVVMMEYIILGLFAVAITIAAVHTLGKTYNNALFTMAKAILGDTNAVVGTLEAAAGEITASMTDVQVYGEDVTTAAAADASIVNWEVYDAQ